MKNKKMIQLEQFETSGKNFKQPSENTNNKSVENVEKGRNLLMLSLENENFELSKILRDNEKNGKPVEKDENGKTLFQLALSRGQYDLAYTIIKYSQKTKDGKILTSAELAEKFGVSEDIIEKIEQLHLEKNKV